MRMGGNVNTQTSYGTSPHMWLLFLWDPDRSDRVSDSTGWVDVTEGDLQATGVSDTAGIRSVQPFYRYRASVVVYFNTIPIFLSY